MIVALKYPIGLNFNDGALGLIFVPLILLISLNSGKLSAILKIKFLIFLGDISYGIYIFQKPIFIWSVVLFKYVHIDNLTAKFYLAIFFLMSVSALSYIFIETPLRRWVQNFRSSTSKRQ